MDTYLIRHIIQILPPGMNGSHRKQIPNAKFRVSSNFWKFPHLNLDLFFKFKANLKWLVQFNDEATTHKQFNSGLKLQGE